MLSNFKLGRIITGKTISIPFFRFFQDQEVQDPIQHEGMINDQGRSSWEHVDHKLVETLIDEQTTKIAEQIRTAHALLSQLNSLRPRENRRWFTA